MNDGTIIALGAQGRGEVRKDDGLASPPVTAPAPSLAEMVEAVNRAATMLYPNTVEVTREEFEEGYTERFEQRLLAAASVLRDVEALVEATDSLLDEQNGPPLIRYEARWQKAVDDCRAIISRLAERTDPDR